jgi:hypothetical protein
MNCNLGVVVIAISIKLLRSRGFEWIIAAHGFSGIADNRELGHLSPMPF